MLRGEVVGLRARLDSDIEIFETELLNTRSRADGRPYGERDMLVGVALGRGPVGRVGGARRYRPPAARIPGSVRTGMTMVECPEDGAYCAVVGTR